MSERNTTRSMGTRLRSVSGGPNLLTGGGRELNSSDSLNTSFNAGNETTRTSVCVQGSPPTTASAHLP